MPELDPGFVPAVLHARVFRRLAESTGAAVQVRIALEQADGSVFHHETAVLPEAHPLAASENVRHVERLVKFLLWGWGGWRVHVDGPAAIVTALQAHYADTATGRFDSEIIGERIYDRPLEIVATRELPSARATTAPLGRPWNGCRIGFDLTCGRWA
ncbi:MAG TPA: transcriptional regulator, partial [Verrucomicrobiales bacterium]|nr:transcriptional regulator [Verrucomicrobiales bacterium]